jgi:hypothetical protein
MRRWNANYLTHQQLQSALAEANPVQIVLFSKIKVPSVVEDAQYSSTRALERAASTRSTQAIGTVAHSIANNVWSTEMLHGVHEALINQKGCWQEAQPTMTQESSLSSDHPTNKKTTTETKPSSSSFARDLLGALDNNDDHHHKQKKVPNLQVHHRRVRFWDPYPLWEQGGTHFNEYEWIPTCALSMGFIRRLPLVLLWSSFWIRSCPQRRRKKITMGLRVIMATRRIRP